MIPAYIPSPSTNGIHIGPFFVHVYGLMYVFAVAGAILVTSWRWRKQGGDPQLPYEVALWAFPAGLIGGRIYFLITTPSQVPDHWWGPFAIWQGGLGIWGGIAGGVIVGLWVVRRRLSKPDVRRFMDAAAPASVSAAISVAAPALASTVMRRKSTNLTRDWPQRPLSGRLREYGRTERCHWRMLREDAGSDV